MQVLLVIKNKSATLVADLKKRKTKRKRGKNSKRDEIKDKKLNLIS